MDAKKLSIRMRDESFKMVLEAGMTSLGSVYADLLNASSGILLLWIHRDARTSCAFKPGPTLTGFASLLRKGSHPASLWNGEWAQKSSRSV